MLYMGPECHTHRCCLGQKGVQRHEGILKQRVNNLFGKKLSNTPVTVSDVKFCKDKVVKIKTRAAIFVKLKPACMYRTVLFMRLMW